MKVSESCWRKMQIMSFRVTRGSFGKVWPKKFKMIFEKYLAGNTFMKYICTQCGEKRGIFWLKRKTWNKSLSWKIMRCSDVGRRHQKTMVTSPVVLETVLEWKTYRARYESMNIWLWITLVHCVCAFQNVASISRTLTVGYKSLLKNKKICFVISQPVVRVWFRVRETFG